MVSSKPEEAGALRIVQLALLGSPEEKEMTDLNYEATIDAKVSEVEDLAKRMGDADYDELLQLADEMKLAISSLEWATNAAKSTEVSNK